MSPSKVPDSIVLPPGISGANFTTALNAFASIVGDENVSRDAKSGLEKYSDPWALTQAERHQPSGAVRPSSAEQVQEILKVANEHSIPLWTISRGKNLGYGGPAPVVRGSVVLDLDLMKKIVEVSEEYGYAIVEPGVTFFDLYEYIQAKGLDLWTSVPALGWGSIVGNCLDRGIGYTPHGDHQQQQCGMEVVLPNGEMLRTGMGAMENSATWALYKNGYGPGVDQLFFQSNLGVVTKLGIWLYPAPSSYISCEVYVPKEEDLAPLITILAQLQRQGILQNYPSISNPFRMAFTRMNNPAIGAKMGPYMGKQASVPDEVLQEIVTEHGWGQWLAQFGVYGPEDVANAHWNEIQRALAKIPGVKCIGVQTTSKDGKPLKPEEVATEEIPHTGIPSITVAGMWDYRGPGGGHTCFSPLVPPSGDLIWTWYLKAKKRVANAGLDFFADFHIYPRHIIPIVLVVFRAEEAELMDKVYRELVEDSVKMGYTEYRTHVSYMDLIADHFDHNNFALRRYVEQIKDLTDPKGILSPGKQGVWGSSNWVQKYRSDE